MPFDQVWSTIREWQWDQEKIGAAWDRARVEPRPQAEQAQTREQMRPIIAKLPATPGEAHFYAIRAEAYDSPQNGGAGGAANPVPLPAPCPLPGFSIQIEFRRPGHIGWFRFKAFLDPEWLQEQLGFAVRDCAACAGFNLDLRGKLGGLVQLAASTAACSCPTRGHRAQ